MAETNEVVNSIVLSSGTVVSIPSFPITEVKTLPAAYSIYSRSSIGICGPVLASLLADSQGGSPLIQYLALNNEDMIELGNILTGGSATAINYNITLPNGHACAILVWYYDFRTSQYLLSNPFSISGSTIQMNYVRFGGSSNSTYFYDNTNYDNENFLYVVEHASTSREIPYYNVRRSGNFTLDVASKTSWFWALGPTSISYQQFLNRLHDYLQTHPNADITLTIYDPTTNDDPYVVDDPATFGGGTGAHEDPDAIEKATIPPLPSLSAVNTGLVTMYGATNAQLGALGSYLWSNLWDIDTNFKKLFADPMNCLIGLSIVPVIPSMGGAQNVKFGNVDTPIALNVLTSQYAEVDCGTLSIKEYIGCFLDYSPYVNISLYLPYIGYRELSPDDVMNDTIHVVYHIDVLTGGCCAMIETGKKGLLYSFNGSCIANVPITAINYSGAIQNAVSAVGAGLTTVAGIATGAAPVAAVGAASMLSNAANTAMNSKPTIQRSGSMGGSAGIMSYQKPLLVITRPRKSVPDRLNKFVGLTTNVTMNLNNCKGFTQVELIHLENVPCTQAEREELLSLLKTGVIF